MAWFCKHEWEIVATTYAPPNDRSMTIHTDSLVRQLAAQGWWSGVTTKMLQCPICKKTKTVAMLGNETVPKNITVNCNLEVGEGAGKETAKRFVEELAKITNLRVNAL